MLSGVADLFSGTKLVYVCLYKYINFLLIVELKNGKENSIIISAIDENELNKKKLC